MNTIHAASAAREAQQDVRNGRRLHSFVRGGLRLDNCAVLQFENQLRHKLMEKLMMS